MNIAPEGKAAAQDAVRLVRQYDLVAQAQVELKRNLATGLASDHTYVALDTAEQLLYGRQGSQQTGATDDERIVAGTLIYWAKCLTDATHAGEQRTAAMTATSAGIKSLQLRRRPDAPGVREWREDMIGILIALSVSSLEEAKTMVPQPNVRIPEDFGTGDVRAAAIEALDEALGIATQED